MNNTQRKLYLSKYIFISNLYSLCHYFIISDILFAHLSVWKRNDMKRDVTLPESKRSKKTQFGRLGGARSTWRRRCVTKHRVWTSPRGVFCFWPRPYHNPHCTAYSTLPFIHCPQTVNRSGLILLSIQMPKDRTKKENLKENKNYTGNFSKTTLFILVIKKLQYET